MLKHARFREDLLERRLDRISTCFGLLTLLDPAITLCLHLVERLSQLIDCATQILYMAKGCCGPQMGCHALNMVYVVDTDANEAVSCRVDRITRTQPCDAG